MSSTTIALQSSIASVLAGFSALRTVVPNDFPAASRYRITVDKMQAYADDRTKTYSHLLNFPLALHAYGSADDPSLRQLVGSLLAALNDFCDRLGHLPGAQSLLAPLWNNAWQDEPETWSIASCVYMALCYHAAGLQVTGFERAIGAGPRDADISVALQSGPARIDVEAFHKPSFGSKTDSDIRAELEVRARRKAVKKFRDLPVGEVGIVAEVAIVSAEDVERRFERKEISRPLPLEGLPYRCWMPLRLVGVRDPDLRFVLSGL